MNEEKWVAWSMQTSRSWADVKDVLKYTNIDFIDNDHRILIEYALDLNHVISKAQKNFTMELIHETKDVLVRFYDYAVEHFHREENFMDKYDLPEVEAHKREHGRILSILKAAIEDFESGKVKVSVKLKMQVMDWLIKHVNIIDFNFFDIENWSGNLMNATSLEEIKPIIHLTGVGDIDEQHMILTSKSIVMMNALSGRISDQEIAEYYDDFIDYALFHFEYEHQFMLKYKIEEMDKHLGDHDYFINKMRSFKSDSLAHICDVHEVKTWILTWWINHINKTDKNYFAYSNWAYDVIANASSMNDVEVVLRRTGYEEVDNEHLALMEIMINLNNEIKAFKCGLRKIGHETNKIDELRHFIKMRKHKSNKSEKKTDREITHKEITLKYLEDALEIATKHFAHEEVIMEKIGVHDLASHKKEHQQIISKLKRLNENFEKDLLDMSSNLKTMILDWWIEHTNTTDFRTFVLRNENVFKDGR